MIPTTIIAIYNSCRICLTNLIGSISHHVTPLVINSLGADTQTHEHTYTYTDIPTEKNLRNQVHTSLWSVRAWFKNIIDYSKLIITTMILYVSKIVMTDIKHQGACNYLIVHNTL